MKENNINLLNINYDEIKPHIIDAYCHVYGDKYKELIESRINNTIVFHYNDVDDFRVYISQLKSHKAIEMYSKFLRKSNLIKNEDIELSNEEIIGKYSKTLYLLLNRGSLEDMYITQLITFDKNNLDYNDCLMIEEIINKKFTSEDEFKSYVSSPEFKSDLKRINEIKNIFREVVEEYNDWMVEILAYEDYIESEDKRKKELEKETFNNAFNLIYMKLSSLEKANLSKLSKEEQLDVLVGKEFGDIPYISGFDSKNMSILMQSQYSYLAHPIINLQKKYLTSLGVLISDELVIRNKDEVKEWLNFLQTPEIKKYIPSPSLISYINFIKSTQVGISKRKFISERKDFLDIMLKCDNVTVKLSEDVYDILSNKRICVSTQGAFKDGKFISTMYFNATKYGLLSYALLHEFGHVIEQNGDKLGFESGCEELNPYDKRFRKYEKFNEVINDIFTIEAKSYLESNDIYLIESKEVVKKDVSDYNTSLKIKEVLKPFISNYRKYIIKAKIYSNPRELYNYIGKNNYEELVDIVNKLQYILSISIGFNKEYYDEVKRLNELYKKMDIYYQSQISTFNEKQSSLSM